MNHHKPKMAKITLGLNLGLYHHDLEWSTSWPRYVWCPLSRKWVRVRVVKSTFYPLLGEKIWWTLVH